VSFFFSRERALLPELPLARRAQERYAFADASRTEWGALKVVDLRAARYLAEHINRRRGELMLAPRVRAGELYAAALLQETLRLIVTSYLEQVDPNALSRAYAHLEQTLGRSDLEGTLRRYLAAFPPKAVEQGEVTPDVYLAGTTAGIPNRTLAFEGALLLYLASENPALERLSDLFETVDLQGTRYRDLMIGLEAFFGEEPGFGAAGQKLFDLLRAPMRAAPTSLEGQLALVRERWGTLPFAEELPELLGELLKASDTLKEETKPTFAGGPGPAEVLDPAAYRPPRDGVTSDEYEAFSPDSSWMPRVVMLAKSTFVWLDQLSKAYGRDIRRLDEIPDEELDELARRGFTALWLIGLWERSKASKTIKNLRGNPDAVASAYALYDYVIAEDLGGFKAFEDLKARAWERGIRLASDMVPNHVGIDGRWVIEHPDWFLGLPEPPYPSYTFNGPDLSQDERVGIFLEDHYYDASDAAVVFKRVDRATGEVRYIYHGNDGTSMPWNDTAQLNYLNPEAREAVIQTILHVARLSPIIRFDAAMTLAKQHIQRLWFPEPGTGGAIASRAQYGAMRAADFEKALPNEFWREVVDRVAQEVPDTLLLAEAFWMMEGYFVRTLGMHRVYNSAFMHMFKNEDNAKYRRSMKNILEFEPEILKRFVNFMNNPDEETAVAQFGKDDKYFGVCVMMATMPGLPMFGHGQVEGFTEKYGMEYRRAKLDETPDRWLLERHEREIFPLLHRRYQFAEVENFRLYDLYTEGGGVNENVFVYSNRVGDEASLVTFNNAFAPAHGWIRESTPLAGRPQTTLVQGLGLRAGERDFVTFRDQISGLSFVRRSRDLQGGLALALDAYKYQVFVDFREVADLDGRYERLERELGGRGVRDLEAALEGVTHGELQRAFSELVNADVIRGLRGERGSAFQRSVQLELPERLVKALVAATELVRRGAGVDGRVQSAEPGGFEAVRVRFAAQLAHLIALPALETLAQGAPEALREELEREMRTKLTDEGSGTLYAALVLREIENVTGEDLEALRLHAPLRDAFAGAGLKDPERALLLTRLLARYAPRYLEGAEALLARFAGDPELHAWMSDPAAKGDEVSATTYDRTAYAELTARLLAASLLAVAGAKGEVERTLADHAEVLRALSRCDARAEGDFAALLAAPQTSDVQPAEDALKVEESSGADGAATPNPAGDALPAVAPSEAAGSEEAVGDETPRAADEPAPGAPQGKQSQRGDVAATAEREAAAPDEASEATPARRKKRTSKRKGRKSKK
jgi:glycosidase